MCRRQGQVSILVLVLVAVGALVVVASSANLTGLFSVDLPDANAPENSAPEQPQMQPPEPAPQSLGIGGLPGGGGVEVSSCQTISSSGSYSLSGNILNSSAGYCITIQASDVTFDCNGFAIEGRYRLDTADPQQVAILIWPLTTEIQNIEIKNCNITKWYDGIHAYGASNIRISDNTISWSQQGVFFQSLFSANSSITHNTFANNGKNIYTYDSSYVIIDYNDILGGATNENILIDHEFVHPVHDFSIAGNTIKFGAYGIKFMGVDASNITDNTIQNNTRGIYFNESRYNNIITNRIQYNQYGLTLNNSYNNSAKQNLIYDNVLYNAQSTGSTNNDLTYNYWGGAPDPVKLSGLTVADVTPYYNSSDMIIPTVYFIDPTPANGTFVLPPYTITVNVSAVDANSSINSCWLDIDGSTYSMTKIGTGNSVTCDYTTSLSLGTHTYTAYADDAAGNIGHSETRTALTLTPYNPFNLTNCQDLNTTGAYYTLMNDITGITGDCFTISANDITLDCMGHSITGGDYYTEGIKVGNAVSGATIKNCGVYNFTYGLYMGMDSSSNSIINNIVSNGRYGVMLDSSDNNLLTGNTVTNNSNGNIWLESSYNNVLNNNLAYGGYGHDISDTLYGNNTGINRCEKLLSYSPQLICVPITATLISDCQTLNTEGGYYALTNNITGVPGDCFTIAANDTTIDCTGHTITGAHIGSPYSGVKLVNYGGATVKNCILNNFYYGVSLHSGTYNNISSNTASNNQYGILLNSSSNNWVAGNTFNNNLNHGIHLKTSSHNDLRNNTASNNSNDGIYFASNSDYNALYGNTFNNNNAGIYLVVGSNNILVNNTACGNGWDIYIFGGSYGNSGDNICTTLNDESGEYLLTCSRICATPISGCQNITSPGVYRLTQNIINSPVTSSCIDIRANDVTLDCGGHTIDGIDSGAAKGIVADGRQYITIKNCVTSDWRYGMYINANSASSEIINNTFSSNFVGFSAYNSIYLTITNNLVTADNDVGMELAYSSHNTLTGNTANSFGLFNSSNNMLIQNTANNGGFNIYGQIYPVLISSGNVLTGNTAINSDNGFTIDANCNLNTLTSNTASNNYYGIAIYSNNNTIINNVASNNQHGIYLTAASNNNVTNNTFNSNGVRGITLENGGSNNFFETNTIWNNSGLGIAIGFEGGYPSTGIVVRGNNISNNGQRITTEGGAEAAGMSVYGTYISIYSNYFYNNGAAIGGAIGGTAIEAGGMTGSVIVGNTFEYHSYAGINNLGTGNMILDNYFHNSNPNDGNGGQDIYIPSNTIVRNNVVDSDGRCLEGSGSNVIFERNNITNCGTIYGTQWFNPSSSTIAHNIFNTQLKLGGGSGNSIYDNKFMYGVTSTATNSWNTTKTSGPNIIGGPYIAGNYWPTYGGEDLNGDLIGDTDLPFTSLGGITVGGDYAPLVTAPVLITNCMNITTPGTYSLQNDIAYSGSGAGSVCFNIKADGVVLDCNGHTIASIAGGEHGIFANGKTGVTVRNCIITDFTRGIYFQFSPNGKIINNTADSNLFGIYIYDSANSRLTNNTANNNRQEGIRIQSTTNNILTGNTATNNTDRGIVIDNADSNTLTSNTACANKNKDIYLTSDSTGNSGDNTCTNKQDDDANTGLTCTIGSCPDVTAPIVTFVTPPTPANGADFLPPATIDINVDAINSGIVTSCTLIWNGIEEPLPITMGDGTSHVMCGKTKTGLLPGTYTFKAKANDNSGNIGYTEQRTITVTADTTIPTVSFVPPTPSDGAIIRTATIAVNVTANDARLAISSCTLTWNGIDESMTITSGAGTSSVVCEKSKTSLADGTYTFKVKADDTAGNMGYTEQRTVYVALSAITGCKNITMPGSYVLANNIANSTADICINVQTSNVELNCQNYMIDGITKLDSIGVYAENRNNVTIKNCAVTEWYYGIKFSNSDNGVILNNTACKNIVKDILLSADSNGNSGDNTCKNLQDLDSNSVTCSKRCGKPLYSCGIITVPDYYILANNLTATGSGSCIDIQADNVELDCVGYAINKDYIYADKGVNIANRANITVNNCFITGMEHGIYVLNANACTFNNNTFKANAAGQNAHGIYASNINGSSITNNKVLGITRSGGYGHGIVLNGVNDYVAGNYIDASPYGDYGLALSKVSSSTIYNNTIRYGRIGIGSYDISSNNNISFNDARNAQLYGLAINDSTSDQILYNTFSNNYQQGALLINVSYSNIAFNTFNNNAQYGIWLYNYWGIIIYPNTPSYILSAGSNNNTLNNNNASYNGLSGFVTAKSVNNIFTGNSAFNNGEHGIFFNWAGTDTGSLLNTYLSNNIVEYNNKNGIYCYRSAYTNCYLQDNTAVYNNQSGINFDIYYLAYPHPQNILLNNNASYNKGYGVYIFKGFLDNISNNNINYNGLSGFNATPWMGNFTNNIVSYNNQYGASFSGVTGGITGTIDNNVFNNNNLSGLYFGAAANYSIANANITNNHAENNKNNGIILENGGLTNLIGNSVVQNSQDGIYLNSSPGNNLINNYIEYNSQSGITTLDSDYNNIISNTIAYNNWTGINLGTYSDNASVMFNDVELNGLGISDGKGISAMSSNNIKIDYNNITNSYYGIYSYNTYGATKKGNAISYTTYAVYGSVSGTDPIEDNVINYADVGITLDSTDATDITNNILNNVNTGIVLSESIDNTVTYNTVYYVVTPFVCDYSQGICGEVNSIHNNSFQQVPPVEFMCNDLIDNDADQLIDCADPDCAQNPICAPIVPAITFTEPPTPFDGATVATDSITFQIQVTEQAPPPPVCGNQIVDAGEVCDQSATPNGCPSGYTCTDCTSCTPPAPTCTDPDGTNLYTATCVSTSEGQQLCDDCGLNYMGVSATGPSPIREAICSGSTAVYYDTYCPKGYVCDEGACVGGQGISTSGSATKTFGASSITSATLYFDSNPYTMPCTQIDPTTADCTVTINNIANGWHSYYATATDSYSRTGMSATRTVNVNVQAAFCGNEIIEAGELCDPPGGTNGCFNGNSFSPSYEPNLVCNADCTACITPTACTDTDGGINYIVKGKTCIDGDCMADGCIVDGNIDLREYYCSGGSRLYQDILCEVEFGPGWTCLNGACVAPQPTEIPVYGCQSLDQAGATYILQNNIDDGYDQCFSFYASNIILDCGGHTIAGTGYGSGNGIYAESVNGITVKNCIITNFDNGIQFNSVQNSNLINNTVHDNWQAGIFLYYNSNDNLVSNNHVCNNEYDNNIVIEGSASNIGVNICNGPSGDTGDNPQLTCTPCPVPEICNNQIDDDGDQLIDCADSDCAQDPYCLPIIITECQSLDQAGKTYQLQTDITQPSREPCITILADNVVLDCNDQSLIGPGVSTGWTGIMAQSRNNVLIKNCVIRDWGTAISLRHISNSRLTNNNIYDNQQGIRFDQSSSYNTIDGNTISSNVGGGLSIGMQSGLNSIYNNNISYNLDGIIVMAGSNNNNLTDNIACANRNNDIFLTQDSTGNSGSDNTCDYLRDDDANTGLTCSQSCPPVPEVCNNNKDDDRDDLIDCADSDCAQDPVCAVTIPSRDATNLPAAVLIAPFYTTSAGDTTIILTNTGTITEYVKAYFISADGCFVSDMSFTLTRNQPYPPFLVSDIAPGTTGYMIAYTSDMNGNALGHNTLIGSVEFKEEDTGHYGSYNMIGFRSLNGLAGPTGSLRFDGVYLEKWPNTLLMPGYLASDTDSDNNLALMSPLTNLADGSSFTPVTNVFTAYSESGSGQSIAQTLNSCYLYTPLNSISSAFSRNDLGSETGTIKIQASGTTPAILGAYVHYDVNERSLPNAYSGVNVLAGTCTGGCPTVIINYPGEEA